MAIVSDLPLDIVKEILSRVSITCLKEVRCTCKRWNALSKEEIICQGEANKHEFDGLLLRQYTIFSMSFNIKGIPSIKEVAGSFLNQVKISNIFHCDGLLLCVTISEPIRLVVMNPYLNQTKWIEPRNAYHKFDKYAFGYDENRNHKILRRSFENYNPGFEIYDFKCNKWRVVDINITDWCIHYYQRGISLKGNAYFLATKKYNLLEVDDDEYDSEEVEQVDYFLVCFDYTTERFREHLLPLSFSQYENGTLSSFRDEKLAALYKRSDELVVEIWITEPTNNVVSWSCFLKVGFGFRFDICAASFFISEEKKQAVVFDRYKRCVNNSKCYQAAYIIGQNGNLNKVNLGPALSSKNYCCPLVCSYVPSLVQINQDLKKRKPRRTRKKLKNRKPRFY